MYHITTKYHKIPQNTTNTVYDMICRPTLLQQQTRNGTCLQALVHLEEALRSSRMAVFSAPTELHRKLGARRCVFQFQNPQDSRDMFEFKEQSKPEPPQKNGGQVQGFRFRCSAEVVKPRHAACGQAEQHVAWYGKRHESQLFWGEPWGGSW